MSVTTQVLIVRTRKPRLVVDFSQTINKFTDLDAYPLPSIESLINSISKHKVFTVIDLKSAYHLVPLHPDDRKFTGFEADGVLYQFKRLPFGLTNAVACFQRVMDQLIRDHELKATYSYLDDITICGDSVEEHDRNVQNFMKIAEKYNLILNKDKCRHRMNTVNILGGKISKNCIRPDPSRLEPLLNFPEPTCIKSLKRLLGFFAYYSRWIPRFSDRIQPILHAQLPINKDVRNAITDVKGAIEAAIKWRIDENLPFKLETDASNSCFGAVLSQEERPVAFFSRTLNNTEKRHCAVEKEAGAILEAIRHWRHFLAGRKFTLVTDQKSLSYVFDSKHRNKIRNDKMLRWRTELQSYSFDIVHRPGPLNVVADALSRSSCSINMRKSLFELHESLCHPGITRFMQFVRSRNLPYSLEEVKNMTKSCRVCAKIKPRYFQADEGILIKAMHCVDRLNVDFKGPIQSRSNNKYLFVAVDEYSRFPFAIPCKDTSSETVIQCLQSIFSIFGFPNYLHSDRGAAFMSNSVKAFLRDSGVASSRSTPYHPQGNGQCERFVGLVWRTVLLALETEHLDVVDWELVLLKALHSMRSLLCTATNATPYERMFSFPRKGAYGLSMPSWLCQPGSVLLRRDVRKKGEPYVDEV